MFSFDSILPAIEKFDVAKYCREHGADEEQTHEWTLTCPSCGKDKLIVNAQKKSWHCWVCQTYESVVTPSGLKRRPMAGAGGLIDLIQFLDEVSRFEAVQTILLADLTKTRDLSMMPEFEFLQRLEAHESLDKAPAIPFPEGLSSIQSDPWIQSYARHRGLLDSDIPGYGLFCCQTGRYAGRIIFPVWEGGTFVYFQARATWEPRLGEKLIKALNPPALSGAAVSSEVLFNLDQARNYPRVCVTEAPIDAIHVGPDAVAAFGKKLSGAQVAKLVRAGVTAIDLMWDADAYFDAMQLVPVLASFFDVRVVQLPHSDPGSFTRDQNAWYRSQSNSYHWSVTSL